MSDSYAPMAYPGKEFGGKTLQQRIRHRRRDDDFHLKLDCPTWFRNWVAAIKVMALTDR